MTLSGDLSYDISGDISSDGAIVDTPSGHARAIAELGRLTPRESAESLPATGAPTDRSFGSWLRGCADRMRRALQDGSLHSHRPTDPRVGRWSIPSPVMRAWAAGYDIAAQRLVCDRCIDDQVS